MLLHSSVALHDSCEGRDDAIAFLQFQHHIRVVLLERRQELLQLCDIVRTANPGLMYLHVYVRLPEHELAQVVVQLLVTTQVVIQALEYAIDDDHVLGHGHAEGSIICPIVLLFVTMSGP
jgi:hypothetical protein